MKETAKKILRGSVAALMMLGCVAFCTASTGGCGGGGGEDNSSYKKIPTKKGGGGKLQFYLPAGNKNGGQFIHLD